MSNRYRRQAKRRSIERARAKKKMKRAACPLCGKLHPPTFLDGVAAIMDVLGALSPSVEDIRNAYGIAHSMEEADANAIANDWLHVGQDLYDVLNDRERRKLLSAAAH
jgi:hypothetical protein